MTARILAQHGNVVAADFRPRASEELKIDITCETLFVDGFVTLIRVTTSIAGKSFGSPLHLLGDLATGHIVQLNNHG